MNIKSIFKNKMVIGIICIVIALLIAIILIPAKNKKSDEQITVLRLSKVITESTQITEDMLKTEQVSRSLVPSEAITEKDKVIGKYSSCTIYPIDYITSEKLSDAVSDSNFYGLDGQTMAISVATTELSSSVAGKIIKGDAVTVYSYDTEQKKVVTYPDLQFVEVLAVSNSQAESIEQARAENSGNSDAIIPAAVTLKVTQQQSAELIDMQNKGKIHLTLAGRGMAAQRLLGGENNG